MAAGSEDDLPVFQVWSWEFLWDLRMPRRVFGGVWYLLHDIERVMVLRRWFWH